MKHHCQSDILHCVFQLNLVGSAKVGTAKQDHIFNYQFYLSEDKVVDDSDLDLGYSMFDYENELTTRYLAHAFFELPSKTEKIVSEDNIEL